jgi:hypothetical protein
MRQKHTGVLGSPGLTVSSRVRRCTVVSRRGDSSYCSRLGMLRIGDRLRGILQVKMTRTR